jgi:chromosome segregation ATPase
MKKPLILISIIIFFISCTKTDITLLNLLQDIKEQNNELRQKILSLQKTTDSLAIAINKNDQMTINIDKKLDSVRIQISGLLNQIKDLNTQLTLTNVNIIDVQQKLNELQAKCSSLYNILNNNVVRLNSGLNSL